MEALEDSVCDVWMLYDDMLPQKEGCFLSVKGKLQQPGFYSHNVTTLTVGHANVFIGET